MLIAQVNFPRNYYKGDYITSVYTDRINSEQWSAAVKHISINMNCDEWHRVQDEEMIRFASALFKRKITGVRVIRFTHAMSGFPLWCIDAFCKHEGSTNDYDYRPYYEKESFIDPLTGEEYFYTECFQ
ncbi:hypothetical protein A616_17135 [Brevibacillus brevis X23]|nr:hypothetical protein A616_17135 [Brevibacillus brevis X23]